MYKDEQQWINFMENKSKDAYYGWNKPSANDLKPTPKGEHNELDKPIEFTSI